MTIEPLKAGEMIRPYEVDAKINELIIAFNRHYHAVEAQDRDITTPPKGTK